MSQKLAGSEVLQMAVEIEKKGKAFYDAVVDAVKEENVKRIFQFLADEEVKHELIFTDMLDKVGSGMDGSPYDDTEMVLYFRSLIDRKIFPSEEEGVEMKKEFGDPATAIRIAMSLEKDAVLYFSELLNVVPEKDHPVIQDIIEEERNHIKRILQLKAEMNIN